MRPWAIPLITTYLLTGLAASPALPADDGEASGPWLKTKYGVTLYGYIKLDVAYDDSRTSTGNFARWVEPEMDNPDDNQVNITANQTRLGLEFDTEDRHEVRTRGRVEIDFYGSGTENKPEPMMRHAFLELEWPKSDFRLLAGQTSDVISPLVPPTVNYSVWWWCGNVGYRRPQLRITKGMGNPERTSATFQFAVARDIGHDGPFDPGDTGEDNAVPEFQARLAFTTPMGGDRMGTIGISAHQGEEEYDTGAQGDAVELDSSSVHLDLEIPITKRVTFLAEAFKGKNMDTFLGGIGQGIAVPASGDPREIATSGGWFTLSVAPTDKLSFNLGGGMDDPDDDDLEVGDRSLNRSFYGNIWYKLTPATKIGWELSHWETRYKQAETADNFRVQGGFVFSF